MTPREKLELLRSYRAAGGTGSYVSLIKEAKEYATGGPKKKLPELPSYYNQQQIQDNIVRQYNPITNPDERYIAEERAKNLRVAKREKELQEYYSQPGMISGMNRKPNPSEVREHAESSVAYNDKLYNDPVGTLGPDIAMSVIPELMMLKGPQQAIGRGLNKINPFKSYNPWNKVVDKVDDVTKVLPKSEKVPLDFDINDILKNTSITERKNMEIIKKGNKYFKELSNPESLKRLKEFGEDYDIDLLDAYKKAEERWDYGTNIGKHDRFQVKKTDEDWYGLNTTNWGYEDELRLLDLKQKFGEDSKQVKDFYKNISQEKSINYISDVVPLDRYEKTIWHELSHDINKSIIDSSPKLQQDIKDIFIEKGSANLDKVKKGREFVAEDFYTKKDKVLKDLDNPEKLKEIADNEFDYVTRPTETWAFLSTNLRQDLKNTGIIKDYNEILTLEKLEQAIKNGNTVFSRFEPYIKDKAKFIELFNKMTLSIAPTVLYLQSQNQNKTK